MFRAKNLRHIQNLLFGFGTARAQQFIGTHDKFLRHIHKFSGALKIERQCQAVGSARNFSLICQGLWRDAQIFHGHIARHQGIKRNIIQ